MGLVSQSPALFPFSIFENITLGMPGLTEADVVKAAKLANAHAFIMVPCLPCVLFVWMTLPASFTA